MSVKISDLGNIPNPLDGTELLEIVQSISGVPQSRNVTTLQLGAFAGGNLVGTGVVPPTAGLPFDYDANLNFQNANLLQTAQIGWNGTSEFRISMDAWGADFSIRMTDIAGVGRITFNADPQGSTMLYDNNAGVSSDQVLSTAAPTLGGVFINNLLTGAGLERALTTSDLVGVGNMINIEDEGAPVGTPASTLDFVGAGVTATGAGATKTITIPGGGGVVPPIVLLDNEELQFGTLAGGDYKFLFDGTDMLFRRPSGLTNPVVIESSTNGTGPILELRQTVMVPECSVWFTNNNTNLGFNIAFSPAAGSLSFLTGTDARVQQEFLMTMSRNSGVSIYADNSALRLQTRVEGTQFTEGIYAIERAAAGADLAANGQFWVRNDVPNTPMFTDDVGTDFVLNAAAVVPDPLIIGSINVTSALVPATGGGPYPNVPINIGANLTGTMPMTQLARQRIQAMSSVGSFNGTLFIQIDGGDCIIGDLNGANVTVERGVSVQLQHTGSSLVVAETVAFGLYLNRGSLFVQEVAAAQPDVAARGQFWVRNDVPNTPMFTNDAGTDFVLNSSVTAPIVLLDNEQIQFGTGTDVTMDWDGSQFEIEFAAAASTVRVHDGAQVRFLTPNDADYTFIQQLADRTNVLSTAGAGFWQFQPELRIIDKITFGSGGTASIDETATDMNINVGALSDIRMRSGTDLHLEATANGSVALYWDNARRFETQPINTDGNLSGATLDDAGSVNLFVGFNQMEWRVENQVVGTSANEWREHAGMNMFQDDGAVRTWTTPASADAVVPDGYIIDITNLGAGALTIAEGVGVTLTWLDGSTGATGSRSLAQFGIATLSKRSATQWYIWGSGIS